MVAMRDHFEITNLLQGIIHHWKGMLLRYIMVSVLWLYVNRFSCYSTLTSTFSKQVLFYFDQKCTWPKTFTNINVNVFF